MDYILSPVSRNNVASFAELIVPFGHIAALDSREDLDILLLKDKSVSWHWVKVFTRPV
ncbi:hypothetical protein ACIHCX_16595 [Streptomyces sp. NPDC052043]|uniref:hypothetical protein n=1 Tax=Streptomyces sp. NPDC052043 TaxID=3365684 RepID=UPI0037D7E15F